MKIIIVGLGKVGQTLAFELSKEDNDITVIDNREGVVQDFASQYDIRVSSETVRAIRHRWRPGSRRQICLLR